MNPVAVDIKNLSIRVGNKSVLPPVSFNLPCKGKALLYGRSGSGKTTLMRTIMGFSPQYEGSVMIDGRVMDAQSGWSLRQSSLSYAPQESDPGEGTVRQCLLRPYSYKGNHHLIWDEIELNALCMTLMLPEGVMDLTARELSGGEKRRMMLVSAIMLKRPIMLLDEPTAGLDIESAERVVETVMNLHTTTVLIASHDALWRERVDDEINIGINACQTL